MLKQGIKEKKNSKAYYEKDMTSYEKKMLEYLKI